MVEGEHEVVIVSQVGRNLHLHLLVELRGPFEKRKSNAEFKTQRRLTGG